MTRAEIVASAVPAVWFGAVWLVAGPAAAFSSAITGLAALLFAAWEIGGRLNRGEIIIASDKGETE